MENRTHFYIKDCALASIATGIKAQTLAEFRDKLAIVHHGCIFQHFWGGRLHSTLELREFHNDFSQWAHHGLNDDILAERLDLLNPVEYETVEQLQAEIIDLVEERLDEKGDVIPYTTREDQFHFIRSRIVVFKTAYKLVKPQDMVIVLPKISRSSIFYHFIDAIRRTPKGMNDFSAWLESFGATHRPLIESINTIDPYFISLANLQYRLIEITTAYFAQKR